jgi:hypothetical protein
MIKDRAETDEQKKEVLNRILIVWQKFPELRLMQLIGNLYLGDPYYTEDFKLADQLEKFMDEHARH